MLNSALSSRIRLNPEVEEDESVPETLGTLNLKIARLEQGLKILEQQQAMSKAYPDYRTKLAQQHARFQSQLQHMLKHRRRLLHISREIKTIN